MFTLKISPVHAQALLSAVLSLSFFAGIAVDPALAKSHKKNAEVALSSSNFETNSGSDRADTKAQRREAKQRAAEQKALNNFSGDDSGIYLNAD